MNGLKLLTRPGRIERCLARLMVLGLAVGSVLAVNGCATSAPPAAAIPSFEYPSPLVGPGVPSLERAELKRIERGWHELAAGRTDGALAAAATLAPHPAAALLELEAQAVTEPGAALAALQRLAAAHDAYAVAWLTLSIAAEHAGRETTAFDAAGRAAALWPDSTATRRRRELERRWIDDRVAAATTALATAPATALEAVEATLVLAPDNHDAQLVAAQALAALGRDEEADAVAAKLATEPRAGMLRGELAERRGDWLAAMDLYRAVPLEQPGRERALRRVQLRWRLDVLPRWVGEATASPQVTRAQLAVLLVALLPGLESIHGDRAPLMSDIVDLPSQREIVTVVGLKLMPVDRLEHRFRPQLPVTVEETQQAIEAAVAALDWTPVTWCSGDMVSSPCHTLAAPVTGHEVTTVLMAIAEREMP